MTCVEHWQRPVLSRLSRISASSGQLNDIRHADVRCSLRDDLAQDNKATISHAAPATGVIAVGHSGVPRRAPHSQCGGRFADQGRPVGISCLTMTKTTELDNSHDESSALAISRCSSCLSRTTGNNNCTTASEDWTSSGTRLRMTRSNV